MQKLNNTSIDIQDDTKSTSSYAPQEGNIIGSTEGPIFFASAFGEAVEGWRDRASRELSTPVIQLIHSDGSTHDGSLVVYADDTFVRRNAETASHSTETILADEAIFFTRK